MTSRTPVPEDTAIAFDQLDVADEAPPQTARELEADRDVGESSFRPARPAMLRPTGTEIAVVAVAAAVAAAAAAVVVNGGVTSNASGYALLLVLNVFVFVFAGLAWRRARPWSPYGLALIGYGLASSLYCLAAVSQPLVFSLGVLLWVPGTFFVWWLILAFPSGRLDNAGRVVLALCGAVLLLGCFPKTFLASSMVAGRAARALRRCLSGESDADRRRLVARHGLPPHRHRRHLRRLAS